MGEKIQPPVLRIGAGDFTALVYSGKALLCIHGEIVGIGEALPKAIPFKRGATDEEIVQAWREAGK